MQYKVNGKIYQIPDKELAANMRLLEISKQEAIEMWLDDHDIIINATAEELTAKAKANGVAKEMTRCKSAKKSEHKRERKPDPTKEEIISNLAKFLQSQGVADVQIPNVGKLITFSLNSENFTLNLIRNRKKKWNKCNKRAVVLLRKQWHCCHFLFWK